MSNADSSSILDSSNAERPFRVLGLQQIALGAPDKAPLQELWTTLLGIQKSHEFKSEKENVDEDILILGEGPHAVEVDLMQPLDPSKRPDVSRPALNHVGLWVDDLATAVTWLESKGMRFTPGGIRKGASGHEVCFIHPKSSPEFPLCGQGVLIELVQAPAHLLKA